MLNYNKIKYLLEQRKITIKDFSGKIGMTRQGLQVALDKGTISLNMLEKMSDVLDIPITAFFDSGNISEESQTYGTCEGCKDKQKIIQLLEDKVIMLEERLERYEGKSQRVI